MGKDWDAPWKDADALASARMSGDVIHDPATVGGFQDGAGGNPFSRSRIRYGREGNDMRAFQDWCELWATQCLRVLKPGGHLLAFGGTRTWHRLACAVEDAGFEIRDSIAWLYGSGFPKSLDVSKAIDKAAGAEREKIPTNGSRLHHNRNLNDDGWEKVGADSTVMDSSRAITDDAKRWQGWGTALKPAFEPIVVGRKPLSGTVAGNVLAHGVGALNIDGCRVAAQGRPLIQSASESSTGIYGDGLNGSRNLGTTDVGRWPSNVVIDPDTAEGIDRQSGHSVTPSTVTRGGNRSGNSGLAQLGRQDDVPCYGDEGGASRFFPTFRYQAKAPTDERPTANGVAHPTVKPLDLMRWLVRLVTPVGGLVLEPFAGSGTTAEACIHEHLKCIAIERETDYLPVIVARLTKPIEVGFDFNTTS
jgi:site-specific DNA-methyltransferase (adenine-specific)